jgi:hypothetical protein
MKKPEETDIDRLRHEMKEQERRIALLEAQVKRIMENINRQPGVHI